jgi:hypothetical protein
LIQIARAMHCPNDFRIPLPLRGIGMTQGEKAT